MSTPVAWWHDLEGGEISAQRPPPPGADLAYPKLGTVPAKPTLPPPAFRQSLQAQLMAERDRRQRIAADTPIVVVPPPPVPKQDAAPGANAQAMLATAESPPPPAPAKPRADSPGPTPRPDVAVADTSTLPPIPDAPPPPATFEGVPAEPAPAAPPPTPHRTPAGTLLLFPTGLATLPPSQAPTLKDIAARRGKANVEITGLGEAQSDTPDGQKAAIDLGLARARAVGKSLAELHVPQESIRLGAVAYGRGALVRLLP